MPQRLNTAKQLAIIAWIQTALSITAIWDKQGQNSPELPYISCNIIAGPQFDGTHQVRHKSTDIYTYLFRKIFTLSIQVHATTNHLAFLSTLINSMILSTHRATLRAAGLSIYNDTDITPTDISELLDTGFEKRGVIEVTMAYAEEIDDTIGEINTVGVKGESGTKFENIDITI
ncbi:hypothetical protein KAR91_26495 [Candidatus Pacearchaeota archaeon]|nr:hypothetical protein [Candidatus Pacearchaeota archaeon]